MSHETFSPARTTKNYIHPARTLIIVFSLDSLQSPQIWNIEQDKDRKRESRRQASEAQREKGRQRSRAREKKQRRDFFVGRTISKFCGSGDKMRKASGHQCKVKKKKNVNENTFYISSMKRATKKFLEVSSCSRAK